MTTYGWTLIVILVTIGLILYFDLLNPIKFLPQQCDFGEQIVCMDMILTNDGTLKLNLLNNFPKNITIIDVRVNEYDVTAPPGMDTGPGDMNIYTIPLRIGPAAAKFPIGEKQKLTVQLLFKRTTTQTPSTIAPIHEISGVVVTTVEQGS